MVGVVAEVAKRRKIDEGDGHEHREHTHGSIEERDGVRRIPVNIGKTGARNDLIGADHAANYEADDKQEDP